MGQGHHGGARVRLQLLQRLVRPVLADIDAGKARIARERAARVDHGDVVAGEARHRHQRLGDVHRADHDQAQRRVEHLDEQRPALGRDRRASVAAVRRPHRVQNRLRQRLADDHLARDDERLVAAARASADAPRAASRHGLREGDQGCCAARPILPPGPNGAMLAEFARRMNRCTFGRVCATGREARPVDPMGAPHPPALDQAEADGRPGGRRSADGRGPLADTSENCLVEVLGCPVSPRSSFLLGCSGTRIESQHFGSSGAIERAITRHYERNASEGNCFNPSIDGFTRLTVLEDTPDRLVVHARYLFRDRFQDGDDGGSGGGRCSGFGERTFTLTRSPEGDLVVAMDGQQDEPALRTLIRRCFRLSAAPTRESTGFVSGAHRRALTPRSPPVAAVVSPADRAAAARAPRRQAEPARDRGVVDRRGIEQDRTDRPLVEMHVGEQLAPADQTVVVGIIGAVEVVEADRIRPATSPNAMPERSCAASSAWRQIAHTSRSARSASSSSSDRPPLPSSSAKLQARATQSAARRDWHTGLLSFTNRSKATIGGSGAGLWRAGDQQRQQAREQAADDEPSCHRCVRRS